MTSTVRSVTVRMNAEVAKYVADMRLAGAETRKAFNGTEQAKFNRELTVTQQRLTGVTRGLDATSQRTRQVDNDTQRLSRSLQRGSTDLNRYTGRLGALVKGAVVLAPALVPIATTAVPAIAGLTAGLGAAAGAMGIVLLASNGMGDALKALNAYQLNPTVENLKKLHQTMAAIGPDGREFVQLLDSLEPQLRALQNMARAGLLPGVEDSIGHMLGLLPQLRQFVSTYSTELGSLVAQGGRSLANDGDWQKFFTYLETDGAPIMDAFAKATGNVTAGLADLLRDFAPLERDFSTGLEHWSASFRTWADGLDQTQGFQHFVDYIRSATPQVLAFLRSLGEAIIAFGKAMAPWASTVLPILTDILKLFTGLASSPIGPVIYEAAAALIVFRAASGWLGVGGVGGAAAAGGGLLGVLDKSRLGFRGLAGDIRATSAAMGEMAAISMTAGARTEREIASMAAASTTLRGSMAGIGGRLAPVAGIGGMLLLGAGIGQKSAGKAAALNIPGGALLGASIGTMIAPGVGTAVGAGVGALSGALLTLATHMNSTSDAVKKVTVDWSNLTSTLDGKGRPTAQTRTSAGQTLLTNGLLNTANSAGVSDTATINAATGSRASLAALTAASKAKQAQLQAQLDTYLGVGGGPSYAQIDAREGRAAQADEQVRSLKQQIQAQEDLRSNVAKAASTIDEEEASQRRLKTAMGSSTLSIKEQIAAQQSLHQQMLSNFDAVTSYGQAMQNLAKQAITKEKGFDPFTKAGADNRQAVSDAVQSYNAQSKHVKNSIEGYERMRSALGDYMRAMGASQKQIDKFLGTLDKPHDLIIGVQSQAALDAIARVKAQMATLKDKTVRLNYYVNQINAGNKPKVLPGHSADGTTVPKTGLPYADRHLYLLADGEEVISNRYGQADRHRPLLKAINAGRLADGGTPGAGSLTGGSFGYPLNPAALTKQAAAQAKASKGATDATKKLTKTQLEAIAAGAKANAELKHLSVNLKGIPKDVRKPLRDLLDGSRLAGVSLKDLNKASRLLNKSLTATKSQLSDVKGQRDSLQSAITSSLSRDLWTGPNGGTGNVWTQPGMSTWSAQYAINQLNGITADANEFDLLRQQVEKNGIKGTALNELESNGGLQALRAFAASPALAQQYQQAYTAAFGNGTSKNPGAVGGAAQAAGKDLYGARIDRIDTRLHHLNENVKNVEKAIRDKQASDHASRQQAAIRSGQETKKALDGSAKNARRR